MKQIIIAISFCFAAITSTKAQVRFITKGKIEYEKRVNLHNNMDNSSWSEMMKKTTPKSRTTYFDLYFNESKTLYKPGREVAETQKVSHWILGPAQENEVFTDLKASLLTSKKTVFDETYVINDSVRSIQWRITQDTRTIAGFECRKAVGIIMDSVYVIAFYTDQVAVSGGPESFNNLPGMILGLAIPRLHTTWYATKLELIDPRESDFSISPKGKKINKLELSEKLQDAMKDWGKEGKRNVWQVML